MSRTSGLRPRHITKGPSLSMSETFGFRAPQESLIPDALRNCQAIPDVSKQLKSRYKQLLRKLSKEEILARLDKLIENYGKSIKPLPLKLRILGLLLGTGLIALGGVVVMFALSHSGSIMLGDIVKPIITRVDYLAAMGGLFITFTGYLITHKALTGIWI